MTEQEIIQVLKNCRANDVRTKQLCRERDLKRSMLYGIGRSPSDYSAPRGGGEGGRERLIDAIGELEAQLARLIHETVQRRMEADALLAKLPDATQRLVLELYYIGRMPMWMVGRELNYSVRQCWRAHNAALLHIVYSYRLR